MKRKEKIARSTIGVSISTMVSRILGYIRDMLTARLLGAGMMADAVFVAYRIPNLFRSLLGEGALSSSFIPVFVEFMKTKGEEETKKFVKSIFITFLTVLTLLTIAGWYFAPEIVRLIAPGFLNSPEKLALTINLTRIIFPFMIAIGMGALALGMLNSLGRFIIPALSPCMLSVSEITFILFICPYMEKPVYGLAVSIMIGGFAQLAFQLPELIKKGYFSFSILDGLKNLRSMVNHPGVKKVCMLMLPAAAGLSIGQVNMFVDTILASLLREGSVTVIYFASRVMLLPLSLFGVAIATVSLPLMAESSVESDYNKFKSTMSSGLRMIFFTMLPSTFGLMFFGLPIIRVLFEHGRFKAYDSVITSQALFFFSIGLIAFAGVKVVVSAFYALKDTLTPVLVAVFAMVLNLLLNLIFIIPMGVGGIALATSLAAFFNLFLLMYELRAKIGALGISKMAVSFIKTIFASLPVIAVCILAETAFCNTSKYLQVVITLPLAVIVYLAAAYILKCKELNYILNAVLNRASKIPSAAGESRTTQQG